MRLAGRMLAPKITPKQAAELQGYIGTMQGADADSDLNAVLSDEPALP